MSPDPQPNGAASAFLPRDAVRAFYSGHSLSDGIPEVVAQLAQQKGQPFLFEFQSVGYSLLRDRTAGPSPGARAWTGYQTGKNSQGEGLDVARELATPTRLPDGLRYNALVVTERHDLPEVAATMQTATYLVDFARRARLGNPDTAVLFYHVWMPIDLSDPLRWVHYERSIRRLWECVASRANMQLRKEGATGQDVLVLPGATALAALVEALYRDQVPGLPGMSARQRVTLLFADNVHLSSLGTYFMGLVHYAALFGQSPAPGSAPGVAAETAAFFARLASEHVTAYGRVAAVAATREMEACRAFAERESCELFSALAPPAGVLGYLKYRLRRFRCWQLYQPSSPVNPFADRDPGA